MLAKEISIKRAKPIARYWILYLMLTPMVLYYVIFHYLPMIGIVTAFQDYSVVRGVLASPFVGLKHFTSFFESIYFGRTLRNTFAISVYSLVFGFPSAILLALMLNEMASARYKRVIQTSVYMPHFISIVVICSIVRMFVKGDGIINEVISAFGGKPVMFLNEPGAFYPIYVISSIWQHVGWDSIIYIAALSSVSQELYEAATVDGAGRFAKIWHVSLPGIRPTITVMLILRVGKLMSVGYEKILLLYNPGIYETADVISTYVFRRGMNDGRYSAAAAVGVFNSVINFVLLISSNYFSHRLGQEGLF